MSDDNVLMKFYTVRNRDGKYFRAKGFGGYGETWVDLNKGARVYSRIGPARSQVTYFATNYPEYGIPEIVELHVTKTVAIQETDRVQKAKERQLTAEAKREQRDAKYKLDRAQCQLEDAQRKIDEIKRKRYV